MTTRKHTQQFQKEVHSTTSAISILKINYWVNWFVFETFVMLRRDSETEEARTRLPWPSWPGLPLRTKRCRIWLPSIRRPGPLNVEAESTRIREMSRAAPSKQNSAIAWGIFLSRHCACLLKGKMRTKSCKSLTVFHVNSRWLSCNVRRQS